MATLTTKDKMYLEKLFQMGGGYVLDFSDRTMGEFFTDNVGINIFQEAYNYASGSKANYMRGFWSAANDELVGKSILELIDYINSKIILDDLKAEDFKPALIEECQKIGERLVGNGSSQPSNDTKAYNSRVEAFLKEDFDNINISIKALNSDIQSVIEQRVNEISSILAVAPLASIFLIGSTLEGILLDVAKTNETQFTKASLAPTYKGKVKKTEKWKLNDLINVAYELNYVTKNVQDFSHTLRELRNYIHPRQQAKEGFSPNQDTAKICFQVLKAAITELTA